MTWADTLAPRAVGAGLTAVLRLAGTPARLVAPDDRRGEGANTRHGAAALIGSPGGTEEIAIVALPAVSTSFAAHAVLPLLDAVVPIVLAGRTTFAELRRTLLATAGGGGEGVPVAAVLVLDAKPARRAEADTSA